MSEQTSIRNSNNRTIFNDLLEIAVEEIYTLADKTCKAKGTHRNLDVLLTREWEALSKDNKGKFIGIVGKTLFVGDYDPAKKACDLDITDLCHVLRYSPSLGNKSHPAWTKHDDNLPFVGEDEIEACAIIKEIRNKVYGHDKKIKSLNENVYIVNAARLFKNILVLGYDEEKLNAKINATQLSNENIIQRVNAAYASAEQSQRTEENIVWNPKTIQNKLKKIFADNEEIDLTMYCQRLLIKDKINQMEYDKIEKFVQNIQKQNELARYLSHQGLEGVKALYVEADYFRHSSVVKQLVEYFGSSTFI